MTDIQKALSVEIFERISRRIIDRFAYVTDKEAYGKPEHWSPLREINGRLVGDCEDFCISIAEACDEAGVPAKDMTLHLVAIERSPSTPKPVTIDLNRRSAVSESSIDFSSRSPFAARERPRRVVSRSSSRMR